MIINSSAVSMASSRSYSSYSRSKSASLMTASDQAVQLSLTEEGKSMMEQMKEYGIELNYRRREDEKNSFLENGKPERFADRRPSNEQNPHGAAGVQNKKEIGAKSKEELEIEILRRLIESLRKGRSGRAYSFRSGFEESESSQAVFSLNAWNQAGNAGVPTVWQKTTVTSSFFGEYENTAYEAAGKVRTADGREIEFNISLEMSRAFCEQNETFVQEEIILTDPLVINLNTSHAAVSDQKFLFDIDADGKADEIAGLGEGSGLLALDQNRDGKINDGSELFGAKSGDGFKDLAQYDEDGNGWIDEADAIFKDLKIWMKNEDGSDRLISLKEAGVGALYLGSANTRFSLNDQATNETNAVIQKTGVYLKESGEVGTMQHVDFAV